MAVITASTGTAHHGGKIKNYGGNFPEEYPEKINIWAESGEEGVLPHISSTCPPVAPGGTVSPMGERTTRIWWSLLKKCAVSTVGILVASIGLAVVTDSVQRRRKRGQGEEGKSAIYSGRVWHARFKPTAHHFSYPIFFCLLDLEQLDSAFPW